MNSIALAPLKKIFGLAIDKFTNKFNKTYPNFIKDLGKYSQFDYLIHIRDAPFNLLISTINYKLKITPIVDMMPADVQIVGNIKDLLFLLFKHADSDSLFFQRKISISGNIEAGTALRNNMERINFITLLPLKLPFFNKFFQEYNKKLINTSLKNNKIELVCPAGNFETLKASVGAGADAVYFGFNAHGNARNFAGLNFNFNEAEEAINYAHQNNCKILAAVNAYPHANNIGYIKETINKAVSLKVDAIILADIGMLEYTNKTHPEIEKHLSVQASCSNIDTIKFYIEEFNIKRIILPRVLTLEQISLINAGVEKYNVDLEIFGFGGLCVMAEGRCSLSGYVTGKSPNLNGVCSPANSINYTESSGHHLRFNLDQFIINQFKEKETTCYPTLCKGCYKVEKNTDSQYIFASPSSLSLIPSLGTIMTNKIGALKIEGRQRGVAYVRQVVSTFRHVIDNIHNLNDSELIAINQKLLKMMEGNSKTEGAYYDTWN